MKDLAYVAVITATGYALGIAERGKPGYAPTNYGVVPTYEAASKWADEGNARLGLTPQEAAEIVASSIARQHAQGIA